MKKEKLTGGRSTANVYKIGNTVSRPHKVGSDFSNKFLLFLQEKGYLRSQRFIKTNEENNDIFEYVEGFVPDEIGFTDIEQLCQFMKIVRQMHDLGAEFLNRGKVVCHNDLSPCNVVFVSDNPICIIDWDSAASGERWEDIAYTLWLWINIGSHNRQNIDMLGQMELALVAYGADDSITDNLADKLLWRMDKVKNEMSDDNYQYARTCEWVEFSKSWVVENKERINKLMRG